MSKEEHHGKVIHCNRMAPGRRVMTAVQVPMVGVGGGLPGDLSPAADARGLVIFAHGSGSSRHSPRNRMVAQALNRAGFATLLFDLLSEDEGRDRDKVFDIDLLGQRVAGAIDFVRDRADVRHLPLGLFGASTGAAAALKGAAARPGAVAAVVSRGGRPDLAGPWLDRVDCPVLLIVGGADREVLALNQGALAALHCTKALEIVPGATHLFEEPGALEEVVRAAAAWFGDAFDRAMKAANHVGG